VTRRIVHGRPLFSTIRSTSRLAFTYSQAAMASMPTMDGCTKRGDPALAGARLRAWVFTTFPPANSCTMVAVDRASRVWLTWRHGTEC